jgi:uncharacterized protein involved in exopolysaccharide biosynthesis
METKHEFKDIKDFFKRRKMCFFITFLSIFIIGAAVAIILPPIYMSQTTILVEEQQIPQDYVSSGTPSHVEERIETITQQVLNRNKLLEIIKDFNLYPDLRERYAKTEIINKMLEDISLENIKAPLINKRTSRSIITTIAFTLSYEGKDPNSVQKVTEKLASLYVEEDLRKREKLTAVTEIFLNKELEDLKKQIHLQEKKISEFKTKHLGELPEYAVANLQAVSRLDSEKERAKTRLRTLRDKNIILKGQLATVDPLSPIIVNGDKVATHPKERLKRLYLELLSLQSTLSDKHPDVKKLKREISELESEVGKSDASSAKVKRLMELRNELTVSKRILGPKHPDVIRLTNEEKLLSQEVKKLLTQNTIQKISIENPDNPVYINLEAQIGATEAEIESININLANIDSEAAKYRRRIENTPLVEKEYNELARDYDMLKLKYKEISAKVMEAGIAKEMEETDRGERFTIKSPAYLPEKPYKPSRVGISLFALVVAFGLGLGIATIRESMDRSLRTVDQIKGLTGLPVLSVVSLIETKDEKRRRWRKRLTWILVVICIIGMSFILIDNFVVDLGFIFEKLNQAWAIFVERLKEFA